MSISTSAPATDSAQGVAEVDAVVAHGETPQGDAIVGGVPVGSTFGANGDIRFHGFLRLTINLPAGIVISTSNVAASLCELTPQGVPMIGDARMTVHNVVPTDSNAVVVLGENAWGSDLPTRFQLIIKN